MRSGRCGPGRAKCNFLLKEYDGNARVIRCRDYHSIHDVVGFYGWDIYVTMHGDILDPSDTLSGVGVSDNETIVCMQTPWRVE